MAHEHARPRVNKQIVVELESLVNARKNTDDMEMKLTLDAPSGELVEQTIPTISMSQNAFQMVEDIWPKR